MAEVALRILLVTPPPCEPRHTRPNHSAPTAYNPLTFQTSSGVPTMPVADFSLAGKVAIVTGGSRGIGKSIALALAEAGADVCVAARKPESLEEAVREISATGRRVIAVPTNVREM